MARISEVSADFLRQRGWASRIPEDVREALISELVPKRLKAGETITLGGSTGGHFWALIEGQVGAFVAHATAGAPLAHVLTIKDAPVDGFWSVIVYNAKGFYEAPEASISANSVTAKKNPDGSATIHFGGDPKAANYLRIMPGWNYTVRLYRPRTEAVSGKWTVPDAVPAK